MTSQIRSKTILVLVLYHNKLYCIIRIFYNFISSSCFNLNIFLILYFQRKLLFPFGEPSPPYWTRLFWDWRGLVELEAFSSVLCNELSKASQVDNGTPQGWAGVTSLSSMSSTNWKYASSLWNGFRWVHMHFVAFANGVLTVSRRHGLVFMDQRPSE